MTAALPRVVVVTATALVVACTPCPESGWTPSDDGGITLVDDLSVAGRGCNAPLDAPILAGTTLCGTLHCRGDTCVEGEENDVTDCFSATVEGAARLGDGHCIVVEGEGIITWRHEPQPCAAREEGYAGAADTFTLRGVTPDGVGAFDYYRDEELIYRTLKDAETVEAEGQDATFRAEPPLRDDFVPAKGAVPRLVVAGQPFGLRVGLENDDGPVAWKPSEASLTAVDGDGTARDGVLEDASPGWPRVRLTEGERATLQLTLHDELYSATTLVGVPEARITSLSLHTIWLEGEPSVPRAPVALYADARDDDDGRLEAAPVRWDLLEGRVLPVVMEQPFGREAEVGPWVVLSDVCLPPSQRTGERRARLRASVASVSREIELAWTVPDPGDGTMNPPSDEGFEPDPRCPDAGCSCDAASGGPSPSPAAAGLALLLVLSTLLRRR